VQKPQREWESPVPEQLLTPHSCEVEAMLETGQDIRGMEVCTAEKQMERRTACLQANVEFLQQALMKLDRKTRDRIATATRDLSDARGEIAALKSTIQKLPLWVRNRHCGVLSAVISCPQSY